MNSSQSESLGRRPRSITSHIATVIGVDLALSCAFEVKPELSPRWIITAAIGGCIANEITKRRDSQSQDAEQQTHISQPIAEAGPEFYAFIRQGQAYITPVVHAPINSME